MRTPLLLGILLSSFLVGASASGDELERPKDGGRYRLSLRGVSGYSAGTRGGWMDRLETNANYVIGDLEKGHAALHLSGSIGHSGESGLGHVTFGTDIPTDNKNPATGRSLSGPGFTRLRTLGAELNYALTPLYKTVSLPVFYNLRSRNGSVLRLQAEFGSYRTREEDSNGGKIEAQLKAATPWLADIIRLNTGIQAAVLIPEHKKTSPAPMKIGSLLGLAGGVDVRLGQGWTAGAKAVYERIQTQKETSPEENMPVRSNLSVFATAGYVFQ